MKVGIKTYSDEKGLEYARRIQKHCDFIEILVVPDDDVYKKFKEVEVEITIHCAHQLFGVDTADKTKHERSKEAIQKAIDAADMFNAKHIVVHPGGNISPDSLRVSIDFLKQFDEKRFRVENLPILERKELGATPEEMAEMTKALKCGFCFDFAHACFAAKALGVSWKKHILGFMQLKPSYFHVCGGNVEKGIDHVHLSDGNYDIEFFCSLIPKNAYVALETPPDIEQQIAEIKFLKGQ